MRGVTTLSSLLNFGMFARSAKLISLFSNYISKTWIADSWIWIAETTFILVFLIFFKSRWFFLNCSSLILSWAFSYSPTILQNYSLVNIWFSPLKHQKLEKNNKNKIDKKSLKKHHGYICWVYHWLVITRFPALSDNSKDNSKFESCLQK